MKEVTILLRVDKEIHKKIKLYNEINRRERAEKAALSMDKLRKANAFSSGKESVQVIREWRNRRK